MRLASSIAPSPTPGILVISDEPMVGCHATICDHCGKSGFIGVAPSSHRWRLCKGCFVEIFPETRTALVVEEEG